MDFKSELQNLVNRFPGMIKKVKVEFVKEIEVEPNGAPSIQFQPVPIPAQPQPRVVPLARPQPKADLFILDETVKAFPGTTVEGARPMPTIEKKNLSQKEQSLVNATLAELNKPVEM